MLHSIDSRTFSWKFLSQAKTSSTQIVAGYAPYQDRARTTRRRWIERSNESAMVRIQPHEHALYDQSDFTYARFNSEQSKKILRRRKASLDGMESVCLSGCVLHPCPSLVSCSSLIVSLRDRAPPRVKETSLCHCMCTCPLPRGLYGRRLILLPSLCDVICQGVIWIRCSQ